MCGEKDSKICIIFFGEKEDWYERVSEHYKEDPMNFFHTKIDLEKDIVFGEDYMYGELFIVKGKRKSFIHYR